MKTTTMLTVAALCAAFSHGLFAGVRVEIDKSNKQDRTCQIAADEFRKFYKELTGRDAAGETRVLLKIDPTMSADGYDAFSMKSDDKGAVLTGGNPRSVLYAVYDLLEKRGGCRWFWDGDVVPKITELDLANLDYETKSRFKFRACRYFSHRGMTRFRSFQWGMDDWKKEIDYLAKIKVNCFMMRMGWTDLFQKAFPDVCEYPDPSVRLPGALDGYDNQSLYWSLQFCGLLRKNVQNYGFERGMMIPEDFGTMTHWYTRTPKSFVDKMKPDFLPNAVDWYNDPTALVWDIRNPKWMDMYWKLTETSIREYGRPDILHTMGLSERTCSTNKEENLRIKIDVMRKLILDAKRRYPESTIILGGWDFHFTWEPEECQQLFASLADLDNVILWDYESDETREKGIVTRRLDESILSNWGVIGKFPYAFGVFINSASSVDIRAEYPLIEREWAKSKDDPKCVGYIWWGEAEHTDILWYEYFSKNVWSPKHKVEDLIPGFCRDRYGAQGAKLEPLWRKLLPISFGHGYDHMYSQILPYMPKNFGKEDFRPVPWRKCLNEAPAIFRGLADVEWNDPRIRRDSIDMARTVADRFLYAVLSKLQLSYKEWTKGADNAAEVRKYLTASRQMIDALTEALSLHTDYSIWESFVRLDQVEKVRNPDFPRVLLENAICHYCLGYQYEAHEYWYRPAIRDIEKGVLAQLEGGDRKAKLRIPLVDYHQWMMGTPLKEMAPTRARTPENFRQAMLGLAAGAEVVCPHAPDADESIHFDVADEFFN